MNIVKPYAKIYYPSEGSINILRRIEAIARISHRSEEAQTENSWERFIKNVVIDRGDWSVTEHFVISVEFLVDRGITHELVRHRIGAYTQESTRFVNYDKKMPASFINPFDEAVNAEWFTVIQQVENSYKTLISYGIAPQIARSVFPNALASKIVVTYNLRSWRHFFLMRTSKEAHPQMREVTIPLLAEFKTLIPILYDDIEPNQRQIDNMRKSR